MTKTTLALGILIVALSGSIEAEAQIRCGTPQALERFRVRALPMPRPSSTKTLDSDKYPLRFHYPADAAISEQQGAMIMFFMEQAWHYSVDVLGYDAPPGDGTAGGDERIDFYVEDLSYMSAGGVTVPETVSYERSDRYALSGYVSLDASAGLNCETVSHEFHHVIQMGYDGAEDPAFFENTSSYIQGLVCSGVPYVGWVLDTFQQSPGLAIDYFTPGDAYQYGAYLWLQFLSEAYWDGDPLPVRLLWEGTKQVSSNNEPDYLDAADAILKADRGTDLWGMLSRFSEWRLVAGRYDDGRHFSNGAAWDSGATVAIQDTHNANGRINDAEGLPVAETGTSYIMLDNVLSRDALVDFSFDGDPSASWHVQAIRLAEGKGRAQVVESGIEGASGAFTFPISGDDASAVIAITNLGDFSHDPDLDEWTQAPFKYSYEVRDPPDTDTGTPSAEDAGADAGNGGDGSGCGCRAAGLSRGRSLLDLAMSVALAELGM
ncbi:MAG: hypothetical protein PHU25_05795 [Deltaproteobacteria bacterium]|nr:hypothetical protein [Deltaproteobacteria bacterium]